MRASPQDRGITWVQVELDIIAFGSVCPGYCKRDQVMAWLNGAGEGPAMAEASNLFMVYSNQV